jgi:AcrR family transcriptional regulator
MDEIKMREWLLNQTTMRLFRTGFDGLTMDSLAEDAGISKKTLYRLVPSKADLLKMVIGRQIESVENKMKVILANPHMSFQEKLDSMLREASEVLSRLPRNTSRQLIKMGPDVWEMVRFKRASLLDLIVELLVQGREIGMIRKDLPPAFLAKSLHLIIDTLMTPRMAVDSDLGLTELLNLTLKMIYGGILTDLGRQTAITSELT